ncbi:MAG TPA: hypothetical protein VEY05_17790 [Beijerinckiaceae bacterium]|nr:hypothetical protein [Beijerinckiaceae bacterium]
MRRMPVAVLLGGFLALPSLAAACSCAPPTIEDLIESEGDIAVFTARVVSVLTPEKGKPALVRLQIGEIIRGEVPRLIEMSGVTREDNPCGVDFRPGELRTLAAYRRDGRWHTDLCHVPRH